MGSGNVKGKRKKRPFEPRAKRLGIGELTIVGAEPTDNPTVTIAQSERDYFVKSSDSYGRAIQRTALNSDEKQRQMKNLTEYYDTKVKVLGSGEDRRWQVTTTPKFPETKPKCMYQNTFTADGELVAVGNYHAANEQIKYLQKTFDYERDLKISNSTVFWYQRQFLITQGIVLEPLYILTRSEISNSETQSTARVCFLLTCAMTSFPAEWSYYWDMDGPSAVCTSALLGTPNGLGAIYLARDWGKELGIGAIDFIEVTKPKPQNVRQVSLSIVFKQPK